MHAMDLVHTCNRMITNRHGGKSVFISSLHSCSFDKEREQRNNSQLIIQNSLTVFVIVFVQTLLFFRKQCGKLQKESKMWILRLAHSDKPVALPKRRESCGE
jgi:hypothetical protein